MSKWFSLALQVKKYTKKTNPASLHGLTTESVLRFWRECTYDGLCEQQPAEETHSTANKCLTWKQSNSSQVFCTLSASWQPSMKGTSDKQTNLSVSIVMYEWSVLFPETSRCLGRQGSPIKKTLCPKPVITAIIQLDLICIIKVCYCLAVEATLRPCSYQMDDLRHLGKGYILKWPLNAINQYYDKPLKWSW